MRIIIVKAATWGWRIVQHEGQIVVDEDDGWPTKEDAERAARRALREAHADALVAHGGRL